MPLQPEMQKVAGATQLALGLMELPKISHVCEPCWRELAVGMEKWQLAQMSLRFFRSWQASFASEDRLKMRLAQVKVLANGAPGRQDPELRTMAGALVALRKLVEDA